MRMWVVGSEWVLDVCYQWWKGGYGDLERCKDKEKILIAGDFM